MFLSILRISASTVLKISPEIIVSIVCAVVAFSILTNQPEAQILSTEPATTLAGKKEI